MVNNYNNQYCKIILITELKFHCMYLISRFQTLLSQKNSILIIRNTNNINIEEIKKLHNFTDIDKIYMLNKTNKVYGKLSNSELSLLQQHGIPKISFDKINHILFTTDLNCDNELKQYIFNITNNNTYIGIFLDCILNNWWLSLSSNIINAHSAVLPHARGINAIEQIVASGDFNKFMKSVGATIHYIDDGIDTGKIIKFKHLKFPLSYNSIWELKGACYLLAYDLLYNYLSKPFMIIDPKFKNIDHNNKLYLSKNFSENIKLISEKNFLFFKQSYSSLQHIN